MNPLRLKKVVLENYRKFQGRHEWVLRPGVNFVQGENDAGGCDSNDSGKTTLCTAIEWAFFGEINTGAKKDELINWHRRDMMVEVYMEGLTVRRTRRRKGSENLSFWDETERGWTLSETDLNFPERIAYDLKEVQQKLESRLGVSKAIFHNSFWIDRESKSVQFLFAKPAERMKILEELVSESFYTGLREFTSKRRTKIETAAKTLESKAAVQAALLSEKKAHLLTRRENIRNEAARAQAQAEVMAAELEAITQKVMRQREVVHARQAEETAALKEMPVGIDPTEARVRVASLQAQNDAMVEKWKTMWVGQPNTECPTCRSKIKADQYKALDHEKRKLYTQIQLHIATVRSAETLRDRVLALQKKVDIAHVVLTRERNQLAILERELDLKKEAPRADSDVEAQKQALERDLQAWKELAGQHAANTEALHDIQQQVPRYKIAEEGFGSRGILNMLLDDYRQLIGQYAQEYLRFFVGESMQLEFPQSDKGFIINLTYNGQQADIENFGRGIVWRALLSVLLGIRRSILSMSQSNLDFLIIDDGFNDVDRTGEAYTIELANSLAKEIGHVIMTIPRPHPNILSEQVVTVKCVNGVSSIVV